MRLPLPRMHVECDGRLIACETWEGSPWLVLIPGSFQDARQWDEVVDAIDARIGLVVVELPGHGDSDLWAEEPSIERFARDIWHLLDALGVTSGVYLGGHSIGGMIALEMGRTRPASVRGLIAVEGWTNGQAAVDTGFAGRMYATLPPELLARQQALSAHAAGRLTLEARQAFARAWTQWDGTTFLQETDIPILELWGDRGDPPPTRAQLHLPARGNITLAWLAGASHNLPLEQPRNVATAITGFIQATSPIPHRNRLRPSAYGDCPLPLCQP